MSMRWKMKIVVAKYSILLECAAAVDPNCRQITSNSHQRFTVISADSALPEISKK